MKIFVYATAFYRRNKLREFRWVWFDFERLVAATKFCYGDKDFRKNSRFVAATCCCNVLASAVPRALSIVPDWVSPVPNRKERWNGYSQMDRHSSQLPIFSEAKMAPWRRFKIKLRPSKYTRGNQDYDIDFLPNCFVTNSLCFPLRPIRVGVFNSLPFLLVWMFHQSCSCWRFLFWFVSHITI